MIKEEPEGDKNPHVEQEFGTIYDKICDKSIQIIHIGILALNIYS